METIYIDNNTLENYKKIKAVVSNESDLYVHDNTLYKILVPSCRDEERQINIELLSYYSHPNCVFPKDIICDAKSEEFIGLTEEYLRGYKTLSKMLSSMSFAKRKELVYKICDIQSFLEREEISFIDMHTHNVMIKDDNLKVIDLDSAKKVNYSKYSEVFEYIRRNLISKNLAIICFLLLYGKDFDVRTINPILVKELLDKSNDKQKVLVDKVFHKTDIIEPIEYLDEFDEDYMEESKLILRK